MRYDEQVKNIMGGNIIGPDEINNMSPLLYKKVREIPEIPYNKEELLLKRNEYILILGVSHFADGSPVTIRNYKRIFGINPELSEPCMYNQDWYEQENFIDEGMQEKWFLIRKEVFEGSRAIMPQVLEKQYVFPKAITCTFAFFTAWKVLGLKLWWHDYVWCDNFDHNGDRIYVGKYHDVDGINKNGFSVHRHLEIRSCYGCID